MDLRGERNVLFITESLHAASYLTDAVHFREYYGLIIWLERIYSVPLLSELFH